MPAPKEVSKEEAVAEALRLVEMGTADAHAEVVSVYNDNVGWLGYDSAWCAATVSTILVNAGAEDLAPLDCGCGNLMRKANNMGIWQENDDYVPDPGDIIIYDWNDSHVYGENSINMASSEGHDHTGMVVAVEDGYIYIAEGNMGNYGAMGIRKIPVNYAYTRGFILPNYSDRDVNKNVVPITYLDKYIKSTSNYRGTGSGTYYGYGSSGSGGGSRRSAYGLGWGTFARAFSGLNSYTGKRNSYGEACGKVNSFLSRGVYSIWYRMRLGALEISSMGANNIFVSLEYNKNGTGQANSFTLNLAYVPKPGTDPNIIDKALVLSDSDTKGCKVTMQYGYTNGPSSPVYQGLALDYSVEIRDGMLYYTITGYSGVVASITETREYNEFGDVDNPETWWRPTIIAYIALQLALGKEGYKIEYRIDHKDARVHIPARYDVTVFEYVNDLLLSARYENEEDPNELKDRVMYSYYIDDAKKVVVISSFSPKDSDRMNVPTYNFNWMSKDNNMIIDFRPDFKGSIALSVNIATGARTEDPRYYVDLSEGLVSIDALEDITSNDAVSEANKAAAIWAEAIQTPYTATLTTIGVPCDAPIGEVIEINPLIYGVKHHTAGRYMITGTKDLIDANGYQTVASLMKISK